MSPSKPDQAGNRTKPNPGVFPEAWHAQQQHNCPQPAWLQSKYIKPDMLPRTASAITFTIDVGNNLT